MKENSPTTLLRIEMPARSEASDARCRAALDVGFDGIELAVDSKDFDTNEAVPTREVVSASPIPIIGAVSAECRVGPWDEAVSRATSLLRSASHFGVKCLNLTIAPSVSGTDPGATPGSDVLNFAFRLLRDLRFEAESSGVALALEAGVYGELLSPVALREVVDATNSWAIGVCVDINRLCAVTDPAEWIVMLHRRIHSVRINPTADTNLAASPSGQGSVELAAIGRALRRIDYDRILIVAGTGEPATIRSALSAFEGIVATPHNAVGYSS